MQYRTHEDGPLVTISVLILVDMHFDLPMSFTPMHSHTFDHWMECMHGSARVVIDGVQTILKKGDRYLVEKEKRHGVWPLEVGTKLRCEQPFTGDIPMALLDGLTIRGNHAAG